MNITPPLLIPNPLPSTPERAVGAVRAPNRSRDAAEDNERQRHATQALEPANRDQRGARAESLVQPLDPNLSAHANRALASYAQVSDDPQRGGLQTLLGFDDYA